MFERGPNVTTVMVPGAEATVDTKYSAAVMSLRIGDTSGSNGSSTPPRPA
jgi:hypothetical protein